MTNEGSIKLGVFPIGHAGRSLGVLESSLGTKYEQQYERSPLLLEHTDLQLTTPYVQSENENRLGIDTGLSIEQRMYSPFSSPLGRRYASRFEPKISEPIEVVAQMVVNALDEVSQGTDRLKLYASVSRHLNQRIEENGGRGQTEDLIGERYYVNKHESAESTTLFIELLKTTPAITERTPYTDEELGLT